MREHRAMSGKLIYYASRRELETLPGYRGNDRKGRACCPIHDGDNPTALAIDWETGWASCWSCGDAWSIRVEDHPDTKAVPNRYQAGTGSRALKAPPKRPQNVRTAPRRADRGPHDQRPAEPDFDALRATLAAAIETAVERLPGSPGEVYLAGRGIPLDVAQALQIGWVTTGTLAGRVVFPLCGPDGLATSATGRAANDNARPKYKALAGSSGYVKTLFNGGAIAQARRSGHPVIVVEGPLDAAACIAAGLPLAVALCGKAYRHPEHFAGVATVILALDADDAGREARRQLWLDLTARGIEVLVLPTSALAGAKDLGEYWQQHHALPVQLGGRAIGPHLHGAHAALPHGLGITSDLSAVEGASLVLPTLEELHQRTAEAARDLTMTPDDLPGDLKAEAEAIAVELGNDIDALGTFWTDLHRREHLLTVEDRCAANYVVRLAMKSCSDDQDALSTIAISSSVSPYSLYTSRSISRATAAILACLWRFPWSLAQAAPLTT